MEAKKRIQEAKQIMQRYDRDGDRKLGLAEFTKLVGDLEVVRIFHTFDKNGSAPEEWAAVTRRMFMEWQGGSQRPIVAVHLFAEESAHLLGFPIENLRPGQLGQHASLSRPDQLGI